MKEIEIDLELPVWGDIYKTVRTEIRAQVGSEKMRKIEIDLEVAIQEDTIMVGLYMTLWVQKI